MSNYRRVCIPGGSYFFTVVCWRRKAVFTDPERLEILRKAFREVMKERPYKMDAVVILPDHLHCIWELPEGDDDFSSRWREIKKYVTTRVKIDAKEKIWQPRFWEHCLRDAEDWRRHVDYIHYNPVKHGLVHAPGDWLYSSFHQAVCKGWYAQNWGCSCPENIRNLDFE